MRRSLPKSRGVLLLDAPGGSSGRSKGKQQLDLRGGTEMITKRAKRGRVNLGRSPQYPVPRGLLIGF